MNIFQVRDSGPNLALNTRYFWIEESEIDGDWRDQDLQARVLLVSSDFKFAKFQDKFYRVCEINIDYDDGIDCPGARVVGVMPINCNNDTPFIKVWEKDPFAGFDLEYMPPMPVDEPEHDYVI